MKFAPMEYRKFVRMLKDEGCSIQDSGYPHIVEILYNDETIATFSVTHGKKTKGKEVKPAYIREFQKQLAAVKEREAAEQSPIDHKGDDSDEKEGTSPSANNPRHSPIDLE